MFIYKIIGQIICTVVPIHSKTKWQNFEWLEENDSDCQFVEI